MAIEITQPKPLQARPRVEILSRRLTCRGMQYTIADDLWINTVTVVEDELTRLRLIGCSCEMDAAFITCSHILLVEKTEQAYHEQAKQRESYCSVFNIYD